MELGDETNNKCEECISGYQFNSLVNKKNNCYKQCDSYNLYYTIDKTSCQDTVPDGFYCNDETAKTIAQCDPKCSKCDKESHDDDKCISCNNGNGYYPKYGEKNNLYKECYYKDTKLEGLYLNLENNDFEQCFNLCKYCSESGNQNNHNCEECISGYNFNSFFSDKNNCFIICEFYYNIDHTSCLENVPDGFYCNNSDAKTITQCDSKCSKCDKESIDNNKCISRNNDNEYYPKYNEKDNEYKTCYSKDSKFEGLYLNLTNNMFEHCYQSCKYCSEHGDGNNHKCEECISGYSFISEIGYENNCYEICEYNYYINSSTKEYRCTKDEK